MERPVVVISTCISRFDHNMQKVKQMCKIYTVIVGNDAQVEMLPNQEPFVGADTRLTRGFGQVHWNLEWKF